jgi:hypothetical protein
MGFYNFCLSLIVCWFLFGFVLRHPRLSLNHAILLATTLTLAYFTHLAGFLMAAVGIAWFAATSPHRFQNLGLWIAAVFPSALLTADFFFGNRFF